MKRSSLLKALQVIGAVFMSAACSVRTAPAADVLVEAEAFTERGGWLLDPQFMDQMGSPYLLAHGLGKPVANAKTAVEFPETGSYYVWVRAKDWAPAHHPGRFKVLIDGQELAETFGENGRDWSWHKSGSVEVKAKKVNIELKDLTGFVGRCDAIYFTTNKDAVPPDKPDEVMASWRRKLLGIPETPGDAGQFDLVVVGGGVAGTCAAVSAARLGLHVALVQERPVLGGNASSEIKIGPYGLGRPRVDEIVAKLRQDKPFAAEKNLQLFFEMHACAVEKNGNRLVAVIASHTSTGQRMRFAAPLFVDCTGDGWIGFWAGADYRQGRESYREFNESLAPNEADKRTHGNSIVFQTAMAKEPVTFPDVPWATEVSKDYAQMANIPRKAWDPHHFWEYGQGLDTLQEAERIRDHLLCAIYGTYSTVKTKYPEAANLQLAWVGHIAARDESRRFIGDYILNQNDVAAGRVFPDAVAISMKNWFCLHYIQPEYDFRGGAPRPASESAGRGPMPPVAIPEEPRPACADSLPVGQCATVPFRCLYSRNVENLLLAGRCVSASHVAAMNIKVQKTTGQMGLAVGAAAFLCQKHDTTPRGVYQRHLAELQDIVFERGDKLDDAPPKPAAPPPATMKTAPAATMLAVEPIRKEFSAAKAAEYLDANAHAFEKQCFACHATYAYLMARPKLALPSPLQRETRLALEQSVDKLPAVASAGESAEPLRVSDTVMTAAALALHDASTTDKLHPQTRKALGRMWNLQREDGGWDWIKLKEPPSAIDDHFGVTMAAYAAGIAPEDYVSTPQARQGLERLRTYLRSHPPTTTHQRAMLLASTCVRGITTDEQRAHTIAELFALQRPDGGWTMASLADDTWKRKDGTPQQIDVSDGYGTGFVLYVLRTAGISANDPRLQKAVAWLKTHQRESGGWFTRAPRHRDELSSYAGTVYAILALSACGAI